MGFDIGGAFKGAVSSIVNPSSQVSPFGVYGQAMIDAYQGGTGGGGQAGTAGGQQGMGAPPPFSPYSSGQPIQNPQPYNMQGGDLSQRGMGENMFALMGQNYTAPGNSEKFADNTLNQYAGGTPQGTNNQQTNYGRFEANKPNVSAEPGLGAYYDRAVDRSTTDINNQLAARGVYGSSGGLGRIMDATTDLRADQARHEADYNLQRLGEQRNWEGLQGQLAQGADTNSLQNSGNQLSWLSGLGNVAQGGDAFGLSRLNSGLGAANAAQGLEQGRTQQLFGDEMAMGGNMSGLMGQGYDQMLQGDQGLMGNSMGMGMGGAAEAQNQDYRTQAQNLNTAETAMSMYGGAAGGSYGAKAQKWAQGL